MKKFLITIFVVVIIAGTAVGAYLYTRKPIEPEINSLPVTRGDIIQQVGATGTVEAVTTVDVGTQVNGVIKEMYADFNDIVSQGKLIAKIDPATIEAKIEMDKASLASAEANLERQKVTLEDSKNKLRRTQDLFDRKLATAQDLETAQVNVKTNEASIKAQEASITQTRANLHQDEVNLGYTNIYAPITGIVINRKVDVGQTVVSNNAATSMFQIAADLTQMQVKASVDESDVGLLRPGQRATFSVDAYLGETFEGSVQQVRLQPVVTQNVVTYVTIINVPNPDYKLKPGMTANVKIEIARRENVLRVPNSAIRFRPTREIFEALALEVPADLQQRAGGGRGANGARGEGGMAMNGEGRRGGNGGRNGGAYQRGGGDRPGTGTQPADRQATLRRGEGQGGGGQFDPAQARQRMQERMANMTAEERQAFMARMRERGIDPNNPQAGGGRGGFGRRGGGQAGSQANAANASGIADRGASTIDALFGPLSFPETRGRVWIYTAVNGKAQSLKAYPVRLGISDGTYTELMELPQGLSEGALLVASIDTGSATTAIRNTSPIMPGGRGGPGGFRGGH